MKVLNIDALAKQPDRILVIKNKKHVVQEMTVENFIQTTADAVRLEEATIPEQIAGTVAMIMRSVPTLERDDLVGVGLESLNRIVDFIKGDAVDGVEETKEGEDDGKK